MRRPIAMLLCRVWIVGCAVATASAGDADRNVEIPAPLVDAAAFHSVDPQLTRLITILLEENPEVQSAQASARSRLERVPQQKALPDLRLDYRYFIESPETRVGPQVQGLAVRQTLPWGGKRGLQARRAEHEASGAAWSVHDRARGHVAELKRNYFEALYLQEALVVNSEEMALLRRFERIALTRYATGEGIQQSVIKVQTDISRLLDQETALLQRFDMKSRRIAQLLGRPEFSVPLQPARVTLQPLEFDRHALEREASHGHPRVRAVEQGIQADQAWIERAGLASRPDFHVGLNWIEVGDRDDAAGVANPPERNGQDIWAVSVGVSFPLQRRRPRAEAAEARENMRSTEWRLESTRDALLYAVQEAGLRIESSERRARLYQDVIVPQAEQSLASAEAAYTTDRQGFLDLIDAERVLFQARLTYHRLIADLWIAASDMEFALGRAFPSREDPS